MAKKHKDASTAVDQRAANGLEHPPAFPVAPRELSRPAPSSGWVEPVGASVAATVRTVRDLLPSRLPVFLGTTALLVTGLIDPPVALGVGLAFEALRRWEPAPVRIIAADRLG